MRKRNEIELNPKNIGGQIERQKDRVSRRQAN
jgi:hypothetical protein